MLHQEGKSIYLRLASNDASVKVSNSQYSVDLTSWPNELGRGVTGISLVSASFPQNVTNVTENNNQFAWHTKTGSGSLTIDSTYSTYITITEVSTGLTASQVCPWSFGTTVYTDADFVTLWNNVLFEYHICFSNLISITPEFSAVFDPAEFKVSLNADEQIVFENPAGSVYRYAIGTSADEKNLATHIKFDDSDLDLFNSTSVDLITTHMPSIVHTSTIPVGWYSYDDFVTTVIGLMASGGAFTMAEISDIDQRSVLTCTSTPTDVIRFAPLRYGTTASALFGLDADTGAVGTPAITFQYVGNLHGPQTLYIHSSKLTGHNSMDGDGSIISIAKAIPITAEYRALQTFVNNDSGHPDHHMPRRKVFRKVNITLRDGEGKAVDIGAGNLQVKFRLYY